MPEIDIFMLGVVYNALTKNPFFIPNWYVAISTTKRVLIDDIII